MTDSTRSEVALRQDNCADGCHVFTTTTWHDGRPRCECGKVMDEHLTDEEKGMGVR